MCYYSGGRFWRFRGPFLKAFPGSNRPDIARNQESQKSWIFWGNKIWESHWTIRLKNGPRNRHFSLFTIFGFLNFRSEFLDFHRSPYKISKIGHISITSLPTPILSTHIRAIQTPIRPNNTKYAWGWWESYRDMGHFRIDVMEPVDIFLTKKEKNTHKKYVSEIIRFLGKVSCILGISR